MPDEERVMWWIVTLLLVAAWVGLIFLAASAFGQTIDVQECANDGTDCAQVCESVGVRHNTDALATTVLCVRDAPPPPPPPCPPPPTGAIFANGFEGEDCEP